VVDHSAAIRKALSATLSADTDPDVGATHGSDALRPLLEGFKINSDAGEPAERAVLNSQSGSLAAGSEKDPSSVHLFPPMTLWASFAPGAGGVHRRNE
jgi:hypothetical protein